jgi:hypothetical protein
MDKPFGSNLPWWVNTIAIGFIAIGMLGAVFLGWEYGGAEQQPIPTVLGICAAVFAVGLALWRGIDGS